VKICHVTQTKFNQLAEENIHMIHQPAHKAYLSDIKVTNKSYTQKDGGGNQLAYILHEITSLSPFV